jgi:hypothetical protein
MLTHADLCSGGSPASIPRTSSAMLIRQHTSAYVSIRQHTSAYVSIRQNTSASVSGWGIRQWMQHTTAPAPLRQYCERQTPHTRHARLPSHETHLDVARAALHLKHHCCAYIRIRQHTSADVAYVSGCASQASLMCPPQAPRLHHPRSKSPVSLC